MHIFFKRILEIIYFISYLAVLTVGILIIILLITSQLPSFAREGGGGGRGRREGGNDAVLRYQITTE